MKKYVLGFPAGQDLDEVWEYIAADNIEAADRWMDRIFEMFDMLAQSPGLGHCREDLTALPVLFWPVEA